MKKNNSISTITILAVSFLLGLIGPATVLAGEGQSVNLGTAGNFTILSKAGISTTGATLITGDIGVSPVAATYITGFGLILPATSPFSTSNLVTGKVYASDYTAPTPTNLTTAILDMQTAYTDAMGRAPGVTELGAGNVGGLTLPYGVYKWSTGLVIPTDVTLSGSANSVWIFQVAQNLNLSPATKIILTGGAQASNIFWVVAGQTTIGTTAVFNGNILDQTAIVLNTGATLNGKALAQTAVTLDANSVNSSPSTVVVTPTPPPTPPVTTSTPTPTSTPATPAVHAVPAVPATPPSVTSTPAVPATPATPAIPAVPAVPASINNNAENSIITNNENIVVPDAVIFEEPIRVVTVNLGKGHKNANVKTLQEFLISQNNGKAAQVLAKVGATSYFGVLTRAALAEFQAKVGIKPAWGNFGPITRAYLSENYN